jgi:hypothetical protein
MCNNLICKDLLEPTESTEYRDLRALPEHLVRKDFKAFKEIPDHRAFKV